MVADPKMVEYHGQPQVESYVLTIMNMVSLRCVRCAMRGVGGAGRPASWTPGLGRRSGVRALESRRAGWVRGATRRKRGPRWAFWGGAAAQSRGSGDGRGLQLLSATTWGAVVVLVHSPWSKQTFPLCAVILGHWGRGSTQSGWPLPATPAFVSVRRVCPGLESASC